MPPSSVLLTRYRTARRYPVICRGSTTLCHGVALLFARCSASASAGAAVKWCQQFNIEKQVRAGYYTTQEGIHVWRCDKPGIFVPISDSRVKLSKTDRMLSPGQEAQSNSYSHGNVVLQGAPCGQCRDLCPAGYVPHFWR
ncbi:hypothetical protein ANTPLA_LOCUS3506 [Anthophora plagiata]